MNYRHAYHAGNFADVVKHVALTAVLQHLKKKDKPFCIVDSHAGRGLYDLGSDEARRTGESSRGVARILDLGGSKDLPVSFAAYLDCVRAEGEGHYPGSPRIVARMLRPQDRLVTLEKHPEEEAALATALAPFPNAKAVCADGYERLSSLLPPPERRGAVLIDPPYEAPDEFVRAAETLANAHRRFATGIYLLWFPIKSKATADAFCSEALARGIRRALLLVIDSGQQAEERLASAGLLIVNPPFGFEEEMHAAANLLAPHLGHVPGARAQITVTPLGEMH